MNAFQLKSCVIWGDMAADSAADQYPEEPVCTDCINAEQQKKEDSRIVSVGSSVSDEDAECAFCGQGHES